MEKIENLLGLNYQNVSQLLIKFATNLLIASIIFFVGFWLAKLAAKGIRKVLVKSKTDESLITFLASLTNISIKALVIITGINQLGIEMTSFVALLGAAGLAIGMAFSGTLSNFAGGVMLLAFKPFKVGDTIKTLTETGIVKEIQIFNTYLHTTDNKVVILPNGPVANGNIINYTRENRRRVDVTLNLSYGTDIEKVKNAIQEHIESDKRIFHEPKPVIGVSLIKFDSIDILVNIWAKTADYNSVLYALNENVYRKIHEIEHKD
jgi:small conductance mechanosensitive channel